MFPYRRLKDKIPEVKESLELKGTTHKKAASFSRQEERLFRFCFVLSRERYGRYDRSTIWYFFSVVYLLLVVRVPFPEQFTG